MFQEEVLLIPNLSMNFVILTIESKSDVRLWITVSKPRTKMVIKIIGMVNRAKEVRKETYHIKKHLLSYFKSIGTHNPKLVTPLKSVKDKNDKIVPILAML